jgi:hypothetical protein
MTRYEVARLERQASDAESRKQALDDVVAWLRTNLHYKVAQQLALELLKPAKEREERLLAQLAPTTPKRWATPIAFIPTGPSEAAEPQQQAA